MTSTQLGLLLLGRSTFLSESCLFIRQEVLCTGSFIIFSHSPKCSLSPLNSAVVSLEPSQTETLNPIHTPLLLRGKTGGCQFKWQIWAEISKLIPAAIAAAYCCRYLTFGPALFLIYCMGIDLASNETHVLSSLFMLKRTIKSNCLFFSSKQCVGCFPWQMLCWSPNLASA